MSDDKVVSYFAVDFENRTIAECKSGLELDELIKSTFKNSEMFMHACNLGDYVVIKGEMINFKLRDPKPRLVMPGE